MPRLFIGTFLDNPDQERFSNLQAENTHLETLWQRKTRWVLPAKLHLTWLFLGDVPQELIPNISATLQRVVRDRNRKIQAPTPNISFERVEVWPAPRKPRSIVLTNRQIPAEIATLGRAIRTALIPFYTAASELEENRDFKPHVTLLRVDRRIEEPVKSFADIGKKVDPLEIKELQPLLPVKLEIDDICLIESHLGKGPGVYEVLERVALSGEKP